MPCGKCGQRRKDFQQKRQAVEREKLLKQKEIDNKAKEYYNPDNDPNYKLVNIKDDLLTTKQKRIKYRIMRLQKRAVNQAKQELINSLNKNS